MIDREKQIQEMAKAIFESGVALEGTDFAFGVDGDDHFTRLAQRLINAGYGNVKKAVKEFAERLERKIGASTVADDEDYMFKCGFETLQEHLPKIINELLKEVCN